MYGLKKGGDTGSSNVNDKLYKGSGGPHPLSNKNRVGFQTNVYGTSRHDKYPRKSFRSIKVHDIL